MPRISLLIPISHLDTASNEVVMKNRSRKQCANVCLLPRGRPPCPAHAQPSPARPNPECYCSGCGCAAPKVYCPGDEGYEPPPPPGPPQNACGWGSCLGRK